MREVIEQGRLLIKSKLSPGLQAKVKSGSAHWVTVKEGPLEGRHLLIDGSRPADGKKSYGKILAGHGIPPHVIEKITGATHAHHLEHEQSNGPVKAFPENFEYEIQGRKIKNGKVRRGDGKESDVDRMEEVSPTDRTRAIRAGIIDPVYAYPRLGREKVIMPREVAEKALEQKREIQKNRNENMRINVAGYKELSEAVEHLRDQENIHSRSIERGEVLERNPDAEQKKVDELKNKYPRAAAYLLAEFYSSASNFEKSSAGKLAMEEIRKGEPIEQIIKKMKAWNIEKHFISSRSHLLIKADTNHLVHGKHQSKEWKQAKHAVHMEYGLGPTDGAKYWRRVNDIYERMRTKVGGTKGKDAYRSHMVVGNDGRLIIKH